MAELQKSLQRERERSARHEKDLAAARRDVETRTALTTNAGVEASELKQAAENNVAELQKSLQRERERSARHEQDLAAARHDVETQTALATQAGAEASRLKQAVESNTAELQNSVQQESERSARLEQDLVAARLDLESQTALAAHAKKELLRQSVLNERDRADALAQGLSLTRSAIYAYQAQTAPLAKASEDASPLKAVEQSGAAALQTSLQQERERAGQLEQALVAARRDIDAQTALAAKAGDEVARLTQAAEADAAEQKRSTQKEHERADALAHDLSMARSKIYAYEAQAAKVAEDAAQLKQAEASDIAALRLSQQKERERAEQLARDLAKASRDLEAQTERASEASAEVVRTKQAEERNSAEVRGLLLRERERAERLEKDLALARQDNSALVAKTASAAPPLAATGNAVCEAPQSAPPRQIQNQPVQDKPVDDKPARGKRVQDQVIAARNEGDASVDANDGVQSAKLIARASVLLKQGNIGAARIVLERAVEMGNAQASFALAETYDPLVLPNFGTYGTQGDRN